MDEQTTKSAADAPAVPSSDGERIGPAHLLGDGGTADVSPRPTRRRRWLLPILLTPVILFGLAVVAWAVDTTSGGVARNVLLGGTEVSSLSESELQARVGELAEAYATTPVEVVAGDETYTTDAAGLGLMVDEDRTARGALDVDDDTFVLWQPIVWMRSFFDEREAPLVFQVNRELAHSAMVELEGARRTPPTEPAVKVGEGGELELVPGVDGEGIDAGDLADRLPVAAAQAAPGETIRLEIEQVAIPPLATDAAAREAISSAEDLVDEPIEVQTVGGNRTVEPEQLRGWVALASQPEGTVEVLFDPAAVTRTLRTAFAEIEGRPVDARVTLDGNTPVVLPDRPGLVCCGDDAATRVLAALRSGLPSVELDLVEGRAQVTTADAQAYQIVTQVGGNQAWRDGAPTTGPPGFTTYHAPTGARITNIHRIADLVRGAVIPPGGTFSINEHVGRRTAEKGFVPAGAISNGMYVDEIGGGVSQFATTMFNAAYFAGLDIVEYQAHSEYFDRYPLGREATMGYPAPDLKIRNNTPYGVLIWTSYTQSSLTVTMYSTPYATAEQTAISESTSGRCRVVVTTRTRTFPDGRTEEDQFRARYRPGEGQTC